MIKTIGIDPGIASTGIGIVEGSQSKATKYSFYVIHTSNDISTGDRLNIIFSDLQNIFAKEKPDIIILEDIFSLKEYPKSGILLGKVTGVILLAGAIAKIPIVEIAAREAKQILTGNGRAGKAHLETAVRNFLDAPDPIKPSHASDALALALIGLFRYEK